MALLCDILNTGSELTLGRTLNRHTAWLGHRLFLEGITVRRALTLPDGEIIRDELAHSLQHADIVIVTGGLGPTSDDLSREYTAETLGVGMREDATTMERIIARLAARGRTCGPGQKRQAMVPDGATVLANDAGTAPGLAFLGRDSLPGLRARFLCLLPGPPNELHPMFDQQVRPLLRDAFRHEVTPPELREFHFAGIGEGELAEKVEPLLAGIPDLDIGYCAHASGTMELRLLGPGEAVDAAAAALAGQLGDDCFATRAESLEQNIIRIAREKGLSLAVAESCTGGAVSSRLTDIPGASEVFGFGFVTYANDAKRQLLGVNADILEAWGAVSREVAAAMAEGALEKSGATHAVALTGIAGPGGGSAEKPVGTLWLGLARRGAPTLTRQLHLLGDRETFKRHAGTAAMDFLRRHL